MSDASRKTYIFLDIDGVLNKSSQWKRMYQLDKNCINAFAAFVKYHYPNHSIILTSSWKNGFDPAGKHAPHILELLEYLRPFGMTIVGKTPIIDDEDRSIEINTFILQHHLEEHPCVVFDDDRSLFEETKLLACCTAYFLKASKGFDDQFGTATKRPWIRRFLSGN